MKDIFKRIKLPKENVVLLSINSKVSNFEHPLKEEDDIVFYPPVEDG